MTIGIDISQIVYQGTGVARFTQGLIEAICQNETHHQWLFYAFGLRQSIPKDIPDTITKRGFPLIQFPYPPSFLGWLWNTRHTSVLAKALARTTIHNKLDWFITSDWTEPPLTIKKATIVHDVAFRVIPKTVEPTILAMQTQRLVHVANESDIIFADSQSTANDIRHFYPETKNQITVNYPGISVQPIKTSIIETVKKKYLITKPFILTVGKIEPRKNIKTLIDAFTKWNQTDFELLIVGPKGWETISSPSPDVRLLGYVSDQELRALYSSANTFVYPSLYEGFGFPPLEAMALQCPVAMSNTSSLGEIGQNCALLFNPHSPDEIEKALRFITSDQSLRNHLIQKGKEKSTQLSWKNYYNTLINTLEQAS